MMTHRTFSHTASPPDEHGHCHMLTQWQLQGGETALIAAEGMAHHARRFIRQTFPNVSPLFSPLETAVLPLPCGSWFQVKWVIRGQPPPFTEPPGPPGGLPEALPTPPRLAA